MVKKAQIAADWFVFFLFAMFLVLASLVASMVLIPNSIARSRFYIIQEAEELSDSLFIYGFLRQKIDNKNMADLIALSYITNDYKNLEQKTIETLKRTNRKECFDIYINEKEIPRESKTECKGKEKEFLATLPTSNKEAINFKLVLYE